MGFLLSSVYKSPSLPHRFYIFEKIFKFQFIEQFHLTGHCEEYRKLAWQSPKSVGNLRGSFDSAVLRSG